MDLDVRIGLDTAAGVWVTERSEVPGLTVIDTTRAGLIQQVRIVAPELLELSVSSGLIENNASYEIRISELELNWGRSEVEAARAATLVDKFEVRVPQPRAAG
jgi:hypothetical protein